MLGVTLTEFELGELGGGDSSDSFEDLEVALEFAKGFFDFKKVFVVVLDLCGVCTGDGKVGVEEMPSDVRRLGGDGVLFPIPSAELSAALYTRDPKVIRAVTLYSF